MALQVWLPLIKDGDFTNKGIADIDFINHGATFDASKGKIGGCYNFNKSATNYISESTYNWSNFNSNTFSICCWYLQPSIASGNSQIICIGTNSGWNNIRIGLLRRTSTGVILFSVSNGSSYIGYNCASTYAPIGSWTHIAVTYDNGTIKMFLNGELNKTMTTTVVPALNSSQHLGIGAASNGAETILGNLNDVRIYDNALSEKEIKEISQALICHYKLDDISAADLCNPSASWKLYNNLGQAKLPATLTKTDDFYRGGVVYRTVFTPTEDSISAVRAGGKASRGVYNWNRTFEANTKYVFWIYYKPISGGTDFRVGGTASNIGGWTEIPSQPVGDGWYVVGQYRDGTVATAKTDNVFVSFYVPDAEVGTDVVIDYASPHILEGITEIPADFLTPDTTVYDCSGYGNNGISVGSLSVSTDTPRNSYSMWFSGTQYIKNTNFIFDSNIWTASIWYYRATSPSNYETLFSLAKGNAATDSNKKIYAGLYTSNRYWCKAESSGATISGGATGEWTLFTMSCDGTTARIYVNDTQISTLNAGTALTGRTDLYIGARTNSDDGSTIARGLNGGLSDFRLYATALSADDVKSLYEVSASIDNHGDIHSYEFAENDELNSISKNGVVANGGFVEDGAIAKNGKNLPLTLKKLCVLFDDTVYEEPDGSLWARIFHHANCSTKLFGSTNVFSDLYIDADRWYNVNVCDNVDEWELMLKEKSTTTSTEMKYRWIQTANPHTAAYADVSGAKITKYTSADGYTNFLSASYGGLYRKNSNTFLSENNGTSSSWWGAVGSWTAYQGGIPGFGSNSTSTHIIKTGYMDLYLRIDKFMTWKWTVNEIIEI